MSSPDPGSDEDNGFLPAEGKALEVLVAVDRSPEAADAALAATALLGPDAHYTFISIAKYETPENGLGLGASADLLAIRDRIVEHAIVDAAKVAMSRADHADVDDATIAIEVGPVGAAVCEYAKNENIDVIVMGSRQRSVWNRIFHPSAGRYVLDNAPCPVLVVR